MRREISLYISDRKVDLDEQSLILMNYTMDDLGNPTIVKNSYSKQITLHGTPNNNAIFGAIWRADRTTLFGSSTIGVYFDATRRTPFQIFSSSGEILEEGYVKLDNIKRDGGNVDYQISLYGGLGSFFFALTYDEEGNKRNLYDDMYYTDLNGELRRMGNVGRGGDAVYAAWRYLDTGYFDEDEGAGYNIINFAPCYNGLPEDFDANKAIYRNYFDNLKNYKYIDGVQWSYKSTASSLLVTMANSHTEWEMKELRWYLQRPILSVKALMTAIANPINNGGYQVELDSAFFNDDNECYYNAWITLPLFPKEQRDLGYTSVLLSGMNPPADYLISYAKMFGLLFLYDNASKKVTIMCRNTFYEKYKDSEINLADRIDTTSEMTITPVLADSRWFQMSVDHYGEFAADYKTDYGRVYGLQKINTGYEFNADVKILTDSLVYKGACDVTERNRLFTSNSLSRDEMGGYTEDWILPLYESVKVQYWRVGDDGEENIEQDVTCPYIYDIYPDNADDVYADWLPKPQFHGKDNKGESGENVLLLFCGMKDVPMYTSRQGATYRLTDDDEDMDALNGGVPCWNFKDYIGLTSLPSFRRMKSHGGSNPQVIKQSFDFGVPLAMGVSDLSYDALESTIYKDWWRQYMIDRYDVDTRVMKCKVNLQGLQVGQDLLRRFWWYDNSIWVLNKINNYSLTTDDLVECEFVKVKDKVNYYEGQIYW